MIVVAAESAGATTSMREKRLVSRYAVAPGVTRRVTMRIAPTACMALTTVSARHTTRMPEMRLGDRPMARRWPGSKA